VSTETVTAAMTRGQGPAVLDPYEYSRVPLFGTNAGLFERHLLYDNVIDRTAVDTRDRFEAFARAVRDILSQRWVATESTYDRLKPKRIYYLSMEFLIGRSLANNVANLLLDPAMLHNAPHLTRMVEYLVPCFSHFDKFYYGLGMKMYDWISGKSSLFPSRLLTRQEALYRMPAMQPNHLAGAVSYADGQFDDGRYCLAIVDTFDGLGGAALNYARVTMLEKTPEGKIAAAVVTDQVSNRTVKVVARAFVNATGPFSDVVRNLASAEADSRMRPSKAHLLQFATQSACNLLIQCGTMRSSAKS